MLISIPPPLHSTLLAQDSSRFERKHFMAFFILSLLAPVTPLFVTWFLYPTLAWPTSRRQGPGHSHNWPGDHLAKGWLRDFLLGWKIASTKISHCFNCQQQSGGSRCSLAIKGASPCWGAWLAAEIGCVIFSAWTQRCQKRVPNWKAACPLRAGLQGPCL